MPQLSLFSADARPPRLGDLAGLLCGPGRILRFGEGLTARISVDVADAARAAAVRGAAAPFGITFEPGARTCAGRELRTAYRRDLASLALTWTEARRKAVPEGFQLDGTALRLWAVASGRGDGRGGYLLPLDPAAPETHAPLIAAATRLGLPPARISLPACPACRARADLERAGPEPPPGRRIDLTDRAESDPTDPTDHADGRETAVGEPAVVTTCRPHHLALAPPDPRECPAAGPALRLSGARRMHRLVELVGPAPDGVDPAEWPRHWGRSAG
ncbi:hypothetical protein [Pseudonocardia ailaonensis]|uniref:hypothetical protein n=1 Tax=Pseudonocardia ailaonensis TaxID=367279 RepID=UPI0031DDF478